MEPCRRVKNLFSFCICRCLSLLLQHYVEKNKNHIGLCIFSVHNTPFPGFHRNDTPVVGVDGENPVHTGSSRPERRGCSISDCPYTAVRQGLLLSNLPSRNNSGHNFETTHLQEKIPLPLRLQKRA